MPAHSFIFPKDGRAFALHGKRSVACRSLKRYWDSLSINEQLNAAVANATRAYTAQQCWRIAYISELRAAQRLLTWANWWLDCACPWCVQVSRKILQYSQNSDGLRQEKGRLNRTGPVSTNNISCPSPSCSESLYCTKFCKTMQKARLFSVVGRVASSAEEEVQIVRSAMSYYSESGWNPKPPIINSSTINWC